MQELRLLELLSRVHRRLVRRLTPLFQTEGLSGTEVFVLWKVHKRGSLRATELAGHIGIPPSTFTGILDRLTARGLLKRVPDPGDRRSVLVQETPALAELIGRLTAAIEVELGNIFTALPEGCRERLMTDLEAVCRYLEEEKSGTTVTCCPEDF